MPRLIILTKVPAPDPAPTVSSVTPDTGMESGGEEVVIAGTGFVSGAIVDFAGAPATSVVVDSDEQITCNTPIGTGVVTVRVTNPDEQYGELVNAFTYEDVFNPATLDLSGWWRASFSESPWVGTASAGSSGSRDLTEATNPPVTGAAVNGLVPADFDGTNDVLTNATAISTLLSASAWSMWALVNLDAINTNNADVWLNDPILCDTGAFWGVHLKSGGTVHAFQWDGASKSVSETISTGAWALVQAKYNGTNLLLRVNSGSWQSAAAGNISTLTGTLRAGVTPTGGHALDGRIAEIGIADLVISDADFDNIKSYVNSRYALSL